MALRSSHSSPDRQEFIGYESSHLYLTRLSPRRFANIDIAVARCRILTIPARPHPTINHAVRHKMPAGLQLLIDHEDYGCKVPRRRFYLE